MDLIQRLSRKSETALSELLILPASFQGVLSSAPWFGVRVGKGFRFGDIWCLVIFPSGNILGPGRDFQIWPLLEEGVRTANLCGLGHSAKDTGDF